MSSESTREDAIKFLSGFLLLLGTGIYINAFAGIWTMDSVLAGPNWALIDAFLGGACLFGSYLAHKEASVREYRATYPYKLSEERRQAIRDDQKSILASHRSGEENESRSKRKRGS